MGEAHLQGISVVEGFHPAEYCDSVFDAYRIEVTVCVINVFAEFRLEVEAGQVSGGKDFYPVFNRFGSFGYYVSVVGKVCALPSPRVKFIPILPEPADFARLSEKTILSDMRSSSALWFSKFSKAKPPPLISPLLK